MCKKVKLQRSYGSIKDVLIVSYLLSSQSEIIKISACSPKGAMMQYSVSL